MVHERSVFDGKIRFSAAAKDFVLAPLNIVDQERDDDGVRRQRRQHLLGPKHDLVRPPGPSGRIDDRRAQRFLQISRPRLRVGDFRTSGERITAGHYGAPRDRINSRLIHPDAEFADVERDVVGSRFDPRLDDPTKEGIVDARGIDRDKVDSLGDQVFRRKQRQFIDGAQAHFDDRKADKAACDRKQTV